MPAVLPGQRSRGARSHGNQWLILPVLLFLALLLLALPFVVPVSLTLGRWTLYVDTSRPPTGQWLAPGRWGVSGTTIGGSKIRDGAGRMFHFHGRSRIHSVQAAGWSYYWIWGEGKRVR